MERKKKIGVVFVIGIMLVSVLALCGCTEENGNPSSRSGVDLVDPPDIEVGADGMTNEQENIYKRTLRENQEGNMQHLYVFSLLNGDCLLYSPVDGKVTSSGKRLTPYTVMENEYLDPEDGFTIEIGGETYMTNEVVQDDGTYGSSNEYVYWFDLYDNYHQLYLSGDMMLVVVEYPLDIPNIIVNLELQGGDGE
jgi:hypothetical protein